MRFLILVSFIILSFATNLMAVAPNHTVEWSGKGAGKVVFDGTLHAAKELTCMDCHTSIFPKMSKAAPSAVITMKSIYDGKYCGACHNGVKAFDARKKENCSRCHKK